MMSSDYCHGGSEFYPPMPFNFGCDRDGLLVFVDVAVNILKKMKRKTLKATEHSFFFKEKPVDIAYFVLLLTREFVLRT